ncbi:hypothetical protein CPLU01_00759 [Colletotrichum plurivorum]|uniref:Uncharacterized protein n=1 Tax=Colletotrichum plurivorum TaxID=2175906 RepID=A0A8H6U5B2_9PEZI|nr:hypothetical protein CPLU01_00759 [Colletotrichum plurivorum]
MDHTCSPHLSDQRTFGGAPVSPNEPAIAAQVVRDAAVLSGPFGGGRLSARPGRCSTYAATQRGNTGTKAPRVQK